MDGNTGQPLKSTSVFSEETAHLLSKLFAVISHFQQQYMRIPDIPHYRQPLIWSIFLNSSQLLGVKWSLILIRISLITSGVENILTYLLICYTYLIVFKSLAHF